MNRLDREIDRTFDEGGRKSAVSLYRRNLLVLVFPLAFQMKRDFPQPQRRIQSYCTAQGIACEDVLPWFEGHRPAEVFRLDAAEYYDIWHLTPAGHQLVVKRLAPLVAEILARAR